ncbi:MAG: 5-formyltetrahydrofolate cyclo-ligase [Azospirillaceae bacterium]
MSGQDPSSPERDTALGPAPLSAALLAEKRRLREAALARRAEAHAVAGADAGRRLVEHLLALVDARPPGVASGYSPFRGEIDIGPALDALAARGWRICLPVVAERDAPLQFCYWSKGEAMVAGALGIEVPALRRPAMPDLVLVPLLAFDRTGHRLGYGKGYYDRTLAGLKAAGPVTAIGIGYAAQELDAVPHGPYDVALDAIVTERGPVAIRQSAAGVTPRT